MKKRISISGLLSRLAGSRKLTVDNTVVTDFDLNRFLGSWYEIARFNHRFERGLEQTKANYTLHKDGKIDVMNTGVKNGKPFEAKGVAKLTDTLALLRVSFWGPFYSDYRILLIDNNYEYTLIGSGSDKYLWILSRTPQINDDTKARILAEAKRRGYNITNLIWPNQ